MKKFAIKLTSFILALLLSVSLISCKKPDDGDPDDFVDTYVDTVNKEVISDSNNYFISNGLCEYKILLARNVNSNRDSTQLKAASELNFFMVDAGYQELPIVYDDEISSNVDFNNKYISLGDTTYYNAYCTQNNLTNDVDFFVIGNDGYKIRTANKTILISAYGNNGILYGAYGFLERNMNYRYYAKDEWRITTAKNVKLKNMDVVSVPDFNSRFLDTAVYNTNTDWMIRLRNHGRQGTYLSYLEDGAWTGNDLSMCNQFLRPEEYRAEHPNWYYRDGSNKGGQLCFSTILANKEEDGKPLDEMFKNVLNGFIIPNWKARVVMFGINDNEDKYCRCDACLSEVAKIKHSGQICLLINAMQDKFNAWQQSLPDNDENKNRKLTFAFFAYVYCIEAPINEDGSVIKYDAPYTCLGGNGVTGNGTDTDLELKQEGNVSIAVRVAHLYAENMHPQYDKEYNYDSYTAFESWSKIAPTLAVWDYGTSFWDFLAPYPDWDVISKNYKYYRARGVKEILTQLPSRTSGTSFYAMKLYVRSQLMWDVDQNIEELYKDFIYNYYGPQAGEHIYAYFNYLRDYFKQFTQVSIDEDGNEVSGFINANGERVAYHGDIYEIMSISKYYPYSIITELNKYFTDAESSLNSVKTTEPKYQKYLDRVQVESLFIRYTILKNYTSKYKKSEIVEMINEFERIAAVGNFTQFDSGGGKNGVEQVKDFITRLHSLYGY